MRVKMPNFDGKTFRKALIDRCVVMEKQPFLSYLRESKPKMKTLWKMTHPFLAGMRANSFHFTRSGYERLRPRIFANRID